MTDELEEFMDRLDYCRDLLKRHDMNTAWKMLVRKYGYSRASAYNDMKDCKRFFSRYFDFEDRPFETAMAIEKLSKLYDLAFNAAKTAKDFHHCSKILEQVNTLKGLFAPDTDIDPRMLRPSLIQLVVPTNGRPRTIDVQKDSAITNEVIDLVEGIHFSVDEMKKQIEKTELNDESESD